jgi:hypothetical protein
MSKKAVLPGRYQDLFNRDAVNTVSSASQRQPQPAVVPVVTPTCDDTGEDTAGQEEQSARKRKRNARNKVNMYEAPYNVFEPVFPDDAEDSRVHCTVCTLQTGTKKPITKNGDTMMKHLGSVTHKKWQTQADAAVMAEAPPQGASPTCSLYLLCEALSTGIAVTRALQLAAQ